ncbi:MAG: DUF1404 family protein [Sulfolobaceae archaeon]
MQVRLRSYDLISIILLIITINPFTEDLGFKNVIPYMLSHYSLFTAGALLGYKRRLGILNPTFSIVFSSSMIILLHYPIIFYLGGTNIYFRILDNLLLIFSGYLIGSIVDLISSILKFSLLGLWMLGDTYLSILFMAFPEPYVRYPYTADQYYTLGIIMFVIMNSVAVYLIILYFNKLFSSEK